MSKMWRQLDLTNFLTPRLGVFLSKFIPVLSFFFICSLIFDTSLLKCIQPFSFYWIILCTLLLIIILLWLVRWGWYTVTYRYIVYFFAWIISLIRRVLANRFVQFFILFSITCFLLRVREIILLSREEWSFNFDVIINNFHTILKDHSVFDLNKILGLHFLAVNLFITVLILCFIALYKSRKHIRITDFENNTGLEELDNPARGIAPAIVSEMARLIRLYKTIDEIQPRLMGEAALVNSTIAIKEIDKDFDTALSTVSSVDLGRGMKIDLTQLFRLLGRIAHGPKLCGCIKREGNKLEITVWLSGGKLKGSWRTQSEDDMVKLSIDETTAEISRLIEEIAYRIFTKLGKVGSPRWQAVKHYSEGLWHYRETALTEENRLIRLHEAKIAFNKALSEDNKFSKCYYNLGIVYKELGNEKSAEAAFRRALRVNPDDFDSYYQLARCLFNDFDDARWLCEQAIHFHPANPIAWNLLVFIHYKRWYKESLKENKYKYSGKLDFTKQIITTAHKAALLSWRDLCKAVIKAKDSQTYSDIAKLSIRNLAVLKGMKNCRFNRWIFLQASFLSPKNNDLNFELGKYYYRWKKYKKAGCYFKKVYEAAEDMEEPLRFWACYSKVNAISYESRKEYDKREENEKKLKRITLDGLTHLLDFAADIIQNDKAEMNEEVEAPRIDKNIELIQNAFAIISKREKNPVDMKRIKEIEFIPKLKKCMNELKELRDGEEIINWWEIKFQINPGKNDTHTIEYSDWARAQLNIAVGKRLLELDEDIPLPANLLEDEILKLFLENGDKKLDNAMKEFPSSERICYNLNDAGKKLDNTINRLKNIFEIIKDAIGKLQEEYPNQVKRLRLHLYLALGYLKSHNLETALFYAGEADQEALNNAHKNIQAALFHAREAVRLNPFQPEERLVLGQVYIALDNYDHAVVELEKAFCLDPRNIDILQFLGKAYQTRGQNAYESGKMIQDYMKGREIFTQALKIMRSSSFPEVIIEHKEQIEESHKEQLAEYLDAVALINYYLGYFCYELTEYDTAASHYQAAAQIGYNPVFCLVKAGWCYVNAGIFWRAQKAFEKANYYLKKQPETGHIKHYIEIKIGQASAFIEAAVSIGNKHNLPKLSKRKIQDKYVTAKENLADAEKTLIAFDNLRKKMPTMQHLKELKDKPYESLSLLWFMYHECKGLMYLKEEIKDKKEIIKKYKLALREFEKAIAYSTNARIYYRMAEVHCHCASLSGTSGQLSHLYHARTALDFCKQNDLRQKYDKKIESLRKKLDELEKPRKKEKKPE